MSCFSINNRYLTKKKDKSLYFEKHLPRLKSSLVAGVCVGVWVAGDMLGWGDMCGPCDMGEGAEDMWGEGGTMLWGEGAGWGE